MTAPSAEQQWTCFHCGETFTTVGEARDHFGASEGADPGCLIDRVAVEEGGKPERGRGLLMALRKAEAEIEKLRASDEARDRDAECYHGQTAELARLFDGARTAYGAWLKWEAMEGRALAAEERADAAEASTASLSQSLTEAQGEIARLQAAFEEERTHLENCLASLTEERNQLRKDLAITTLSVPIEDELQPKIDDALKYLAMGQGFTLNGIARLLIECQQRMATDWVEVGRARRESKALTEEREGLRADINQAQLALWTRDGVATPNERSLTGNAVAASQARDYLGEQLRHERAKLAALIAAHERVRETVLSLQAYGDGESTNALTAKDRDQYQFWQGWNSALSKLALASPEGTPRIELHCTACKTVVQPAAWTGECPTCGNGTMREVIVSEGTPSAQDGR